MNLRTIAVDPNYRNQGIATELLKNLESEAKQQNIPAVLLVAYSHNDAMLQLIAKHGYKLYAQEKNPAFCLKNRFTGKITKVYSTVFVKTLEKK